MALAAFNNAARADTAFIFKDGSVVHAEMKILKAACDYFSHYESFSDLASTESSNAKQPTLETENPTDRLRYKIQVQAITPYEETFTRILLFFHSQRAQDLDFEKANAHEYLAIAFLLGLRPEFDFIGKVFSAFERSPNCFDPIYNGFVETLFTEDQMLELVGKSLEIGSECAGFGLPQTIPACPDCPHTKQRNVVCNWCGKSTSAAETSRVCSKCLRCSTHCATHCAIKKHFITLSLPLLWLMSIGQHNRAFDVLTVRARLHDKLASIKSSIESYVSTVAVEVNEIKEDNRDRFRLACRMLYQ